MTDDFDYASYQESRQGFERAMEATEAARIGNLVDAEKLYRAAIGQSRVAGNDLDFVLVRFAEFLISQRRLDEAADMLNEALARGTDIPVTWRLYMTILARRHDVDGMAALYDRLPPGMVKDGPASWILPYAHVGPSTEPSELDFAERLSARVRDECVRRGDQAGAWTAIGVHGQSLVRMDRTDEAVAEWKVAFDSGSQDSATADRLSLNLDRAKDYAGAAAVCRSALSRGLPANVEDKLRKRLERMERKITPGSTKKDVSAFSVRVGEGYATIALQRRLSPPLRDLAVHEETAFCLAYKAEAGIMTRVNVETGEAVRTEGLPAMDEIKISPSGWGLGVRRQGRVGDCSSFLAFLSPDCDLFAAADIPDAVSEISHGANRWFVGCRNGRLYCYDLRGGLLWEWVTPGAEPWGESPYFRPCPYYLAVTEQVVAVSSFQTIYGIAFDGGLIWSIDVPQQGPYTFTHPISGPLGQGEAWTTLEVHPGATDEEVKRAYRKKVFATHPDQNPGDFHAAEKFRRVQRAYEDILAGARLQTAAQMIANAMSFRGFVCGLSAAGNTIVACSSDGVLSRLGASGEVVSRRVLGKSRVTPALRSDGSLAAAYCDGTLSFFEGDQVINAASVGDEYPATLTSWRDDVLFIQGPAAKVFDRIGRNVWTVEFPKRVVAASVNDQFLVCGAGALLVFVRDQPFDSVGSGHRPSARALTEVAVTCE